MPRYKAVSYAQLRKILQEVNSWSPAKRERWKLLAKEYREEKGLEYDKAQRKAWQRIKKEA